jgi:hypothetical protein
VPASSLDFTLEESEEELAIERALVEKTPDSNS